MGLIVDQASPRWAASTGLLYIISSSDPLLCTAIPITAAAVSHLPIKFSAPMILKAPSQESAHQLPALQTKTRENHVFRENQSYYPILSF